VSTLGPFTVGFSTGGVETKWRVEWAEGEGGHAPAEGSASWKLVPGGEGTIAAGVFDTTVETSGALTGLTPETTYWFRASAENACGKNSEVDPLPPGRRRPLASGVEVSNATATSAHLHASVNPENFETHWHLEYATDEAGQWKLAEEGVIPQGEADEQFHQVQADLSGLTPGTTYFVRLRAESEPEFEGHRQHVEVTGATGHFATSGPPAATAFATHALHGEALRLLGSVTPNNGGVNEVQTVTIGGSPTGGSFTLTSGKQTATATGVGNLVAGSNAVLEVQVTSGTFAPGEPVTGAGIPPGTTIKNAEGAQERWSLTLSQPASTSGKAVTVTAGLRRLAFNASAGDVKSALYLLADIGPGNVEVTGPDGGPYTVEFVSARGSSNRPLLEADASGLTPSGSVSVSRVRAGFAYEAGYHFEYVSQKGFEAGGWGEATVLPEQKLTDTATHLVGQDLPALVPGEGYRYRLVASNATPGNPVVHSAEQSLTALAAVEAGPPSSCANEQFRGGLSAHLPDCRAFEQLSPVNKEGAQEAFRYGAELGVGALVGEDGEHFMYEGEKTRWGSAPTDGQSPYFFSRSPAGWGMTAAAAQPEAGFDTYTPRVFSPDLTRFGFEAGWRAELTESGVSVSPDVEFRAGPPGGPYATVATVPRKQLGDPGRWVAASEDFSKLILSVEDRTLLGKPTGTQSGQDLYEYSGGGLRQLNVDSHGATIGTCGASIVRGFESFGGILDSSRRAVSADGARVFFEASPAGVGCEGKHLYVRVDGGGEHPETLDLGAARFLAANSEGTRLILEKPGEVLLYDAASATTRTLFPTQGTDFGSNHASSIAISSDLGTIYFPSGGRVPGTDAPPLEPNTENFYRYDVAAGTLRFLFQAAFGGEGLGGEEGVTPDGRYYSFLARGVGGLRGGALRLHRGGAVGPVRSAQLYRYDGAQDVVECLSCASPTDPEPRLGVQNTGGALTTTMQTDGAPQESFASADGSYAFFETAAALVPADVNGEVPPAETDRGQGEPAQSGSTPSNDVYEWRRAGVDGCAHVQGCVSLITPGTDGYLVALLGTAAEGRDVFFYTSSALLPRDKDTAGDFYDARIGGGFPEPATPVKCEGDACSTPAPAPVDSTPASLVFSGAGNLLAPALTRAPASKPKPRACRRGTVRRRSKCVKPRRRAKAHKQRRTAHR
jgi:hypothetical protein